MDYYNDRFDKLRETSFAAIKLRIDDEKRLCWARARFNINELNRQIHEEANINPENHPDRVVRVTGFSAYFGSLSPDLRQYVVDRVINGD